MHSTNNHLNARTLLGAFAMTAMGLATHGHAQISNTAGLPGSSYGGTTDASSHAGAGPNSADIESLPQTLTLTGVVRDFRERSVEGGHPDFERQPSAGFGHYAYIAADQLDQDGKPAFASTGFKISRQWKDSDSRNVAPPRDHLETAYGSAGATQESPGGAVTSSDSFYSWFRDTPYSMSRPLALTLRRQAGSSVYTFDDKKDLTYQALGGFFPLNGELYGNSAGGSKNFHFTFELDTRFVFKRGSGQVFTFTGDDDVFVYIDSRLVIDIGGVHSAINQSVDLDDLAWLEDGEEYSLKFFFAERHRTQSNFRIDTNLTLRNAELPTVTSLFD